MNKRTDVEQNATALRNCKKHGLTSLISLIVGFPGDSEESLEKTFQFLKESPPDFHFLCTFSTRVSSVPILTEANRQRFGLRTDSSLQTVSPYWTHQSMSCKDVGNYVQKLSHRLIKEKVSLDATIYYRGIHLFDPAARDQLLEFQCQALQSNSWMNPLLKMTNRWIDKNLVRSVDRFFEQGEHPQASS
jgi:hypothetical protein